MFPLNKNTTDGTDKFVTTYYVRDLQGNGLAVYLRRTIHHIRTHSRELFELVLACLTI